MTPENELRRRNVETVCKFFGPRARRAGGAEYRASLCAPDAVKQSAYPIGESYTVLRPKLNLAKLLESSPDVNAGLDLEGIVWATGDPNVVWAEIREHGQVSAAGRTGPFDGWGNHIFRLHNGLVKEWRTFYNTYTIYPVLGLEPGKPDFGGFETLPEPTPEEAREAAEAETLFRTELDPFIGLYALPWEVEDGLRTRLLVKSEWDDGPEARERRERGRRAVEMYFSADLRADNGVARRNRLYTEDGMTQIPFNHISPLSEAITLFIERNMGAGGAGPSWHVEVQQILPTADPDEFWAETRAFHDDTGSAEPGGPSFMSSRYWNHYAFFFKMQDGKIRLAQEFLDPHSERRVMGIADPPLPEEAERFYLYL